MAVSDEEREYYERSEHFWALTLAVVLTSAIVSIAVAIATNAVLMWMAS